MFFSLYYWFEKWFFKKGQGKVRKFWFFSFVGTLILVVSPKLFVKTFIKVKSGGSITLLLTVVISYLTKNIIKLICLYCYKLFMCASFAVLHLNFDPDSQLFAAKRITQNMLAGVSDRIQIISTEKSIPTISNDEEYL